MCINRFQRFFEIKDVERSIKGERPDLVDKLRVKEYGNTHYIYDPDDEN